MAQFTVKMSIHQGGTREQRETHDLHGHGVFGPDGVEVDWSFPGHLAHAENIAARLNKFYADHDIVRCKVCNAIVTSKAPDRFPYCKHCFYTGRAYTNVRGEQIATFANALPGSKVAVEHTGGGCFWVAIRWDDTDEYYILTDGEAGLPYEDEDANVPCVTGGWGYVGWQRDDEDGNTEEEFTELFHSEDAIMDHTKGLTNEQALALIRTDLAKRDPSRVPAQWFTLQEYLMEEREYRGSMHRYLGSPSTAEDGTLMTFTSFTDAADMARFVVEDPTSFPMVAILGHEMYGETEVTGYAMGWVERKVDGTTATVEGDYENDADWKALFDRADTINEEAN